MFYLRNRIFPKIPIILAENIRRRKKPSTRDEGGPGRGWMGLLDEHHQILAGRPEELWIGDAQHILLVDIGGEGVAARGVHGEDARRLGVELDFLVDADVNLGKVVLVEVRLQHLAILHDMLFLEFLLGAEDKPCGVELLVLVADGLRLLLGVGLQVLDIVVEVVYLLVELGDVYILGVEFGLEPLQLLRLVVELLGEVANGLAQLVAVEAALAQLLLQTLHELTVAGHGIGYKLDVLLNLRRLVGAFALAGYAQSVFSLIDGAQPFLDFIERTHHVIDFTVALGDDALQRVVLFHIYQVRR